MIIEIPYVEHQFTDVTKPTIIDLLERCLGNDTHAYFAQYKNTVVMKELHDNGIIIITKTGDKKDKGGLKDYLVYYSRTNKTLLYISILEMLIIMEEECYPE